MKKKSPKPKTTRVPNTENTLSAWQLLRPSLGEYRDNWWPYVKILAVVAIPSDLIALSATLSADALTSAYVSLAALIMNVTIIWAIIKRAKDTKVPNVPTSYYDASASLVRFILVSFALLLMLTPAAFGAALYETGLAAANAASPAGPVQIIVGIVAIPFAYLSFFLLVRYGLAPFAVVEGGLRPMAALRLSRRYTKGRFWRVAGRFGILALGLMVAALPIATVTFVLSLLHLSNIAAVFFEIATTLISLPIANIYIYRLYRNLADTLPAEATTEAADLDLAETTA